MGDGPRPLGEALVVLAQQWPLSPAFLDEARKRSLAISPRDWKEGTALTEKIVSASPEFVAKVKKAVGAPD